MALVYGVLGLIVILTAGTFGTINSSPWFNLGIAVLFVVLGLAMFDVIMIDFSRFRSGIASARRGAAARVRSRSAWARSRRCSPARASRRSSFRWCSSRATCYAAGTTIALALPFVLGIGMALPWPIAGAGLAALPKPGAWMVRVKQAFGVVILATAAYYGYIAYGIFANRWVDPAAVTSSVQEKLKEGWHASLAEGLAAAKREHKPVLIDMWATWCKNCLDDGQDDAEGPGGKGGARRLHEDQVPGRGSRRIAGQGPDAADWCGGIAGVRDRQAEERTLGCAGCHCHGFIAMITMKR